MSLSIQERLKDLRVERGLTLGQLAEQTGLSKSALGSYETEDFKDISHYALIRLAKFYGVFWKSLTDYSKTSVNIDEDNIEHLYLSSTICGFYLIASKSKGRISSLVNQSLSIAVFFTASTLLVYATIARLFMALLHIT